MDAWQQIKHNTHQLLPLDESHKRNDCVLCVTIISTGGEYTIVSRMKNALNACVLVVEYRNMYIVVVVVGGGGGLTGSERNEWLVI